MRSTCFFFLLIFPAFSMEIQNKQPERNDEASNRICNDTKKENELKFQPVQSARVFNNGNLLLMIAQFFNIKEFVCDFRRMNKNVNKILTEHFEKYLEKVGIKNVLSFEKNKTLFTFKDIGVFFKIFNKKYLKQDTEDDEDEYAKFSMFDCRADPIKIETPIKTPQEIGMLANVELIPLDTPFILYSFDWMLLTFYPTVFSEPVKGLGFVFVDYNCDAKYESPSFRITYFFDSKTVSVDYFDGYGLRFVDFPLCQKVENFPVSNKVFITKELLSQSDNILTTLKNLGSKSSR